MSSHKLLRFRLIYVENCDKIIESMFWVNVLEVGMKISYKKLWKLLIDRDMKKKELAEEACISSASIAKLGRNENVNTDILLKICVALECDVSDIMEVVADDDA